MKKFFSLVLALVMALSLTTVAWGAPTHTVNSVSEWDTLLAGSTVADGDIIQLAAGDYSQLVFPVGAPANLTVLGGTGVTVGEVYFYYLNNVKKPCPDGLTLQGITFDGTKIDSTNDEESNGWTGVEANNTAVTNLSIVGCTFNNDAAVRMPHGATNVTISGCTFNGSDDNTIYFQKVNGVTITGNWFYDAGFNAINLTSGLVEGAITITGNVIDGTASRAIRLANVDSSAVVKIENNEISNTNTDPNEARDNGTEAIKASNVTTGATFEVKDNTMPAGAQVVVAPIVDAAALEVTVDANGDVVDGVFYGAPANVVDGYTALQNTDGTYVIVPTVTFGDKFDLYLADKNMSTMLKLKTPSVAGLSFNEVGAHTNQDGSGNVAYIVANNGEYYVKTTTPYTTSYAVTYAGKTDVLYYVNVGSAGAGYYAYEEEVTAFTNFSTYDKCGCVTATPTATDVYFQTEDGVVYKAVTGGATNYLLNGKIVSANAAETVVDHKFVASGYKYDTTYKVNVPTSALCTKCLMTSTTIYKDGKVPAATKFYELWDGNNTTDYSVVAAAASVGGTVVTPDTKVESAETFDAGIAMYVGMSVMAAAGSVVVLKKKD